MIERIGVEPHAVRSPVPCVLYGLGQEMSAQSAAMKVLEEPEVRNLDPFLPIAPQFEVASRRAPYGEQPDRHERI
jgi:hypothetical protein